MKLPISSFLPKKDKTEYILALLLRSEKVSAIIIEQIEGKIKVVGKHEEYFTESIEDITSENLLDILDKTISRAEDMAPASVEVEKTIFGVKDTWVEEKRIKKEYLVKLKKVSDELRLAPIGFLVVSEAIAHLIQEEEGAPLSAIIAEIGKKEVTLSLFRAGKSIETKSAPIHNSVSSTVDTLLKHVNSVEVLPSRVIVFNGDRDEELAQEFISHQWSKTLPFLHVPQVSVLPIGFDARSVVYGAAMQMGFEVLGSLKGTPTDDIKVLPSHPGKRDDHSEDEEKVEGAKDVEDPEAESRRNPSDETTNTDEAEIHTAKAMPIATEGDNFGFVMEKDVASFDDAKEKTTHHDEKPHSEEKDFAIHHQEKETIDHGDHKPMETDDKEDDFDDRKEKSPKKGLQVAALLAGLSALLTKLPIKSLRIPSIAAIRGGSKLIFIPPVVILFLILGTLWYIFKLQAEVVVNVTPKTQEESRDITFSVTSPSDFSESIIQAKSISTTLDGSVETTTTGKKEVGEKAKGSVTIFNSDDSKRELDAGTVIKSANDLEFVIDKDVTIASASGDIFSGIKSGQAKVEVTAKSIGTEYNLPSNTKFALGSSTLAARNDSAFSGGTKKTVQVVAKKDIEKLTKELPGSLSDKAKSEIEKKVGGNETVLPAFLSTNLTKQSLSKKEGEEAKTLTLKANVTFEGVSYQDDDLREFAETLVKDEISDDSALADNGLTFEVVNVKGDEEEVAAKLNIKAGIMPKIDKNVVLSKISGKSFADAEEELKKLPQVSELEMKLKPNIFFLPKRLPRATDNITLVINANE